MSRNAQGDSLYVTLIPLGSQDWPTREELVRGQSLTLVTVVLTLQLRSHAVNIQPSGSVVRHATDGLKVGANVGS